MCLCDSMTLHEIPELCLFHSNRTWLTFAIYTSHRVHFICHVGFSEAELYPMIQNQSQAQSFPVAYIIEFFDVPLINGSLDAGIPTRDKSIVTLFHTVS